MEKNILEILERPFEAHLIKQRPGSFGRILSFVESHEVIRRMNEAFQGDFSFRIMDWRIENDEVIVWSEITAGSQIKHGIGGKKITRNSQDGSIVSLADDIKASCSESLKNGCRLFGVCLSLYGDKGTPATSAKEEKAETKKEESKPEEPKAQASTGNQTTNLATNAQVRAVIALSKRNNLSTKDLSALIKEVAGGVEKVDELDRRSCSTVIQRLQTMAA
jgi:hypothetical protein